MNGYDISKFRQRVLDYSANIDWFNLGGGGDLTGGSKILTGVHSKL